VIMLPRPAWLSSVTFLLCSAILGAAGCTGDNSGGTSTTSEAGLGSTATTGSSSGSGSGATVRSSSGATSASSGGATSGTSSAASGNSSSAASGSSSGATSGSGGSGATGSGSSSGAAVSDAASAFTLTSNGFLTVDGGGIVFPASASGPQNQSPPFSWSGAPSPTRSFALTFVDLDIDATKWVIWDIPSTASNLPSNVDQTTLPANVPGATQLGSLGHVGYAGPGVPSYHRYEFLVWALAVTTLPGTAGQSTDQLRKMVLPAHVIAQTGPYVAEGKQGGP
jgi:Raf kinase inhibitor-like YbhB/YbcL family protein